MIHDRRATYGCPSIEGDVRLLNGVEEALALQAVRAARLGEDHHRLARDRLLNLRQHVERDRRLRDLGHGGCALRSLTSGGGAQLDRVRRAEQQEAGGSVHGVSRR